jgi:2,3-bisphosphoglycerate-independent phosphoglycerate mutase
MGCTSLTGLEVLMNRPLLLLVRDGWGLAPPGPGNAVTLARTPRVTDLKRRYPWCTLTPSGEAVGLRAGSQGSSEVGHLNMGAGRIVEQELLRVDKLIRSGELFSHPRLVALAENCRRRQSAFHLMGLVQDQGVHATEDHLYALVGFARRQGLKQVYVHFFADGRDTPPRSALVYLERLERQFREYGVGQVASVMGRYYGMDRGENWDRTQRAYDALTKGVGLRAPSAKAAIEQAYARADAELARRAQHQNQEEDTPVETDEFIQPTLITGAGREPVALIRPGDSVLHFNYRQDRAIQLTKAFVERDFSAFDRGPRLDLCYAGLTRYYDEFDQEVVPPMNMTNLLGEVLGRHGLRQLRISEYQKFRHVTSFFNGKRIEPFPLEDDIQVPSITIPEDQKPEMSAYAVTDLVVTAVREGIAAVRAKAEALDGAALHVDPAPLDAARAADTYDVIVLNFANCDMVGHTGVLKAAVKAVETVDECTGRVVDAVLARGGAVIVTADHGNAEQMINPETGGTETAHTTGDVECILVSDELKGARLREHGILANIAPTILQLLGLPIPPEMTAQSLLV